MGLSYNLPDNSMPILGKPLETMGRKAIGAKALVTRCYASLVADYKGQTAGNGRTAKLWGLRFGRLFCTLCQPGR